MAIATVDELKAIRDELNDNDRIAAVTAATILESMTGLDKREVLPLVLLCMVNRLPNRSRFRGGRIPHEDIVVAVEDARRRW